MTRRAPALALCLALVAIVTAAACSDNEMAPSLDVPFSTTDLVPGTGAVAVTGNSVTVHYTGWLYDPDAADNKGLQFDSSIGGTPFTLTLGSNQAIDGFDQGILGMSVGGTRRIVIPPHLGYGSSPNGPIPGNSTLLFEVTLVSIP